MPAVALAGRASATTPKPVLSEFRDTAGANGDRVLWDARKVGSREDLV